MISIRTRSGRTGFFALAVLCLVISASSALAQDQKPAAADKNTDDTNLETNLETQLYILVGTSQEVTDAKLPAMLDPVIKDLHALLPFKNYRLTGTLINRVRSGGGISLRWIGGPLLEKAAATNRTPTFSDFSVAVMKFVEEGGGRGKIRMQRFRFNSRIPIETTGAVAANGVAAPVINYETTGLDTDLSVREGEPVIVGTLNAGPSGDAIILVVSARRATK